MKPSWDTYFMELAEVIKIRSPDPKTKVGSVLVSLKNKRIIGSGYNGLVSGVDETLIDWNDRETVTKLIIHAEMNTVLYSHSQFENSVLYTTLSPCQNCLKMLAASHIKKIIFKEKYRDFEEVKRLCRFYNIELQEYIQ
jgi:dCMP deaminase